MDKYVVLCRDLDFESELSYTNPNTTEFDEFLGGDGSCKLIEQLSENGKGFMPIAGGSSENGKVVKQFDGQNFTISNIYINQKGHAGLISKMTGEITIKNLTIQGNITSQEKEAGGFIGNAGGGKTTITNCHNKAKIVGESQTGGITGTLACTQGIELSIIQQCSNEGEIISNSQNAGGISGSVLGGTISDCYNEGTIQAEQGSAGGILGYENWVFNIYNSYNKGKVSGKDPGGIIGFIYQSIIISNTYNIGKVESNSNVAGGVIGSGLWSNPDNEFNYCYYLDIIDKGVGSKITDICIKYSKTQMTASNFIDELNSELENKVWVQDKNNINEGYPILNWQENNI